MQKSEGMHSMQILCRRRSLASLGHPRMQQLQKAKRQTNWHVFCHNNSAALGIQFTPKSTITPFSACCIITVFWHLWQRALNVRAWDISFTDWSVTHAFQQYILWCASDASGIISLALWDALSRVLCDHADNCHTAIFTCQGTTASAASAAAQQQSRALPELFSATGPLSPFKTHYTLRVWLHESFHVHVFDIVEVVHGNHKEKRFKLGTQAQSWPNKALQHSLWLAGRSL